MALRALLPILTALFAACADAGPELDARRREVATHRASWEAGRPAAYVYELERVCFCGEEARGPVRMLVNGSDVVSRTYVATGAAVPSAFAQLFPPVDGLFDILDDALDRGAATVQVTWDDASGLPLEAFIDYAENIADEELGFRIVAVPQAETAG